MKLSYNQRRQIIYEGTQKAIETCHIENDFYINDNKVREFEGWLDRLITRLTADLSKEREIIQKVYDAEYEKTIEEIRTGKLGDSI